MFSSIYQKYIFNIKPYILGFICRILYSRKNIIINNGFLCDSIPRIIVDKSAHLFIQKDVYFRNHVEIRAHQNSKITIYKNVKLDRGVRLLATNNSRMSIGPNTAIGLHSVFNGGDDITIGRSCLISGFVYIQTSMHKHDKDQFIKKQGFTHSPIILGDDVWLGAHSTIMPNCNLKQGTIVGSNAVVTKSSNSNEILAGVPAKKINIRS